MGQENELIAGAESGGARGDETVRGPIIVEARDIVVEYGGQRAVNGVSLSFEPGTVTGIIGPNGAGKSSLLDVLAGVNHPASGRVILDDVDVTDKPPFRRARMGLIRTYQDAQVFGRLSVLDNVVAGLPNQVGDRFWAAVRGPHVWRAQESAAEDQAMQLLKEFQIDHHASTRCDQLSGGQRRIVEYLRALMARPRVLLLDEPSVGLAPWVVERLATDLDRLAREGCCVLLIEHEMDLVKKVCHRVVGMAAGSVVVDGSFDAAIDNEVLQGAYLGRI